MILYYISIEVYMFLFAFHLWNFNELLCSFKLPGHRPHQHPSSSAGELGLHNDSLLREFSLLQNFEVA